MRSRYDAVVIGSGFGGSVSACRLAQGGLRVAVLEKGRRWEKDKFPRSIGEVGGAFWQPRRSHGFLDYQAFRTLDVIQGAGVGGGSLVYFNVHLRADPGIFANGAWPAAISRAVLDPYYDLAQAMMESRPLAPPPGRRELPRRTQVFRNAAARAGRNAELVDIGVFVGEDRAHPASGAPQSACTYCSNCLLGCHNHAKHSTDITYLGLAERRHGAEVFPLHEVVEIAREADGTFRVRFLAHDDDPAAPARAGSVRAERVIVSAGTLGSVRLLLHCRDRAKTLPIGQALGSRFSINGEYLLGGIAESEARVDPAVGPPITSSLTVRDGERFVTVQDLGLPDSIFWYLEGLLPPRLGRLSRIGRLLRTYLGAAFGWKGRGDRLSDHIDGLATGGRTARLLPYLGMGTDSSDGTMRLHGDRLDVEFDLQRNRALYARMHELMQELAAGAGGRFAESFLWRWPLQKMLTAHPLGGCPMGDDPASSVVDHRGQVHGVPKLFVLDGSVLPGALAVNPSLTISAFAERAAFWMLHESDLSPFDSRTPANR